MYALPQKWIMMQFKLFTFLFFIRNVPVIFFKLVCQIYCIWGFKLWHVCLALWLIHYKRKPHKSVHVTNVKNIPFGFSINNALVIFSNWSARSNTFGGMQAKACKPFSVSNALSDKTPQKRSCHKFKSHPLWFFNQQRSGHIFKLVGQIYYIWWVGGKGM